MTMTDPIADMLTRIRNAAKARHESVNMPASNIKQDIARVLKMEGYIKDFYVEQEGAHKTLKIFISYDEKGTAVIGGIKRISKPSCRVYSSYDEIKPVLSGYGISIISSSRGIITDREARKQGVGGEILCSVW